METLKAYDVHEDLRRKLHELQKRLIAIEEAVYALKDAFYHHEHEEIEAALDAHLQARAPEDHEPD